MNFQKWVFYEKKALLWRMYVRQKPNKKGTVNTLVLLMQKNKEYLLLHHFLYYHPCIGGDFYEVHTNR